MHHGNPDDRELALPPGSGKAPLIWMEENSLRRTGGSGGAGSGRELGVSGRRTA